MAQGLGFRGFGDLRFLRFRFKVLVEVSESYVFFVLVPAWLGPQISVVGSQRAQDMLLKAFKEYTLILWVTLNSLMKGCWAPDRGSWVQKPLLSCHLKCQLMVMRVLEGLP